VYRAMKELQTVWLYLALPSVVRSDPFSDPMIGPSNGPHIDIESQWEG
jgi:hypothetical protein